MPAFVGAAARRRAARRAATSGAPSTPPGSSRPRSRAAGVGRRRSPTARSCSRRGSCPSRRPPTRRARAGTARARADRRSRGRTPSFVRSGFGRREQRAGLHDAAPAARARRGTAARTPRRRSRGAASTAPRTCAAVTQWLPPPQPWSSTIVGRPRSLVHHRACAVRFSRDREVAVARRRQERLRSPMRTTRSTTCVPSGPSPRGVERDRGRRRLGKNGLGRPSVPAL